MTIKNLSREEVLSQEEILAQIKYLEQNISNGPVSYRANRLNRIRSLQNRFRRMRASLRLAS
ncbi:MAG TPA: hypothetical protein VKX35_01625 [Fermentimonas sp.]|nr:hypothetical protein [Fermentimonas sp.]